MRRGLLVLLAVLLFPAGAAASPVLVLGRDGHAVRRDDRFLSPAATTPTPASTRPPAPRAAARVGTALRSRTARRPAPTFASALAALVRAGTISSGAAAQAIGAFNAAVAAERHLSGTRLAELRAVTETMHDIAVSRQVFASRLAMIVATLNANRQWWTTGPLLSADERVEFAGSQLVWEYYPGQGLQLQVLGSFGKADGMYTAGPSQYGAMQQLLAQIIPLASSRGGGATWEYYFTFDGGRPPWTSAMSQATGLEALTRAYEATHNPYYLQVAASALPVFTKRPPVGVAVPTARGVRFVQYTFTPGTKIINAFLQTLIGLHDYAQVSGNATARQLFAAGNAEAMFEVPSFNTGAWSLYQPGIEDDLSYHELVTGFLQTLCTDTGAPVYCTTAQQFAADLTTPPALADLTPSATAGRAFALRFRLSKISRVGIVVTSGSQTVFATSATFGYGVRTVTVPALPAGAYGVRLAATDLAGNVGRTTGTLTVH